MSEKFVDGYLNFTEIQVLLARSRFLVDARLRVIRRNVNYRVLVRVRAGASVKVIGMTRTGPGVENGARSGLGPRRMSSIVARRSLRKFIVIIVHVVSTNTLSPDCRRRCIIQVLSRARRNARPRKSTRLRRHRECEYNINRRV